MLIAVALGGMVAAGLPRRSPAIGGSAGGTAGRDPRTGDPRSAGTPGGRTRRPGLRPPALGDDPVPMSDQRLLTFAAQAARLVVLTASATAFVGALVLLAVALL